MKFPVEYSTLSSDALLELVLNNYPVAKGAHITFLKRGFNDTYSINHATGVKYILRVYKYNWRSFESIQTELALLKYLKENGVPVSYPIADHQSDLIQTIHAPEGIRYAVLFSFAPGVQVKKLNAEQAYLLGAQTGKMHLLTQNKSIGVTAHNYDIRPQFETTLKTLKPILTHYVQQYEYLVHLQTEFLTKFKSIDKTQVATGICHGDLQAENFHVSSKNEFTFFDFDFFGTGALIYDIGVFIWYDHKNKPKEIVDAFLKGYQTERKLTETELQLLPWFSTLRALFQMTLYCKISDGKQLPLWPAQQAADFIKKVEKWFTQRNTN